jgi:opacity protein-like surface antigen
LGFQANYGYRLVEGSKAALFAETHLLANSLREITSLNRSATRDVATLYVTPGLRVKFVPRRSLSPYAVVGAGYGLYEQSFFQIDGASNPAPRFTHRGVFAYGGGLDLKVWRFLGARWEVRDFYSGNPSFNAPTRSGSQHNVVVGGGFTLHFQ